MSLASLAWIGLNKRVRRPSHTVYVQYSSVHTLSVGPTNIAKSLEKESRRGKKENSSSLVTRRFVGRPKIFIHSLAFRAERKILDKKGKIAKISR